MISLLALAALDSSKTAAALTIIEPLVIAAANSADWTASTSHEEVRQAANVLVQSLFKEPHLKADPIGEVALTAELRISITLDGDFGMQLVATLPPKRAPLPLSVEAWVPMRDFNGGPPGFEPISVPTSITFLPHKSWNESIQTRWQPLLKAARFVDQQLPVVYRDYLKGIKTGGYIKREDLDPRVRAIFEVSVRASADATPYRTEAAMWKKIESTRIGPARLILALALVVANPAGRNSSGGRTGLCIPVYNGRRLLPGFVGPPEE